MKIQRSIGEQRKLDRFGRCERARITYVASEINAQQIDQALLQIFKEAPGSWQDLPKNSVELLRSPGGGIIEAGVTYRHEDSRSTSRRRTRTRKAGDRSWQAEVNAGCIWKTNGIKKISTVKVDRNAPDLDPGTLINWNGLRGSASVSERFRLYQPEMLLTCEAVFRRSRAESRDYLRKIANLVGKVNSEAFHNWNAGELLFVGLVKSEPFEGSNGEELCELTFRFQIRPGAPGNIDGIEIGMVDGWDHCWPLYGTNGKLHSIHVTRLYERASFAVLDL